MLIQTSERMMWSIKRIFKSVYSNFHIMKSLTIYSIQKAATAGGGSLRRRRSDPCPALLYGILPPAGCRTRSRIIEKLLLLPAHDPAAIAIINRYCFPQRTEAVYLFCPYPGNRSKRYGLRQGQTLNAQRLKRLIRKKRSAGLYHGCGDLVGVGDGAFHGGSLL